MKKYLLGGGQSSSKLIRLNDSNLFKIGIGSRILTNELDENGLINVISANVYESFGKVNKEIIEDYSKQYILWGIDGDWMVRTTDIDEKFYPTDHCGYIEVLDENINPKYLAILLEKEGLNLRFSRSNRASIERVSNINVLIPEIEEQNKIIDEIIKLENEIFEIEKKLNEFKQQKENIVNTILEIEYTRIS